MIPFCHLLQLNLSFYKPSVKKKGRVVTSEELFKYVWTDEYYDKNSNTITVHIRHLREKMGDVIDEPRYIKTIWGVGYKIES